MAKTTRRDSANPDSAEAASPRPAYDWHLQEALSRFLFLDRVADPPGPIAAQTQQLGAAAYPSSWDPFDILADLLHGATYLQAHPTSVRWARLADVLRIALEQHLAVDGEWQEVMRQREEGKHTSRLQYQFEEELERKLESADEVAAVPPLPPPAPPEGRVENMPAAPTVTGPSRHRRNGSLSPGRDPGGREPRHDWPTFDAEARSFARMLANHPRPARALQAHMVEWCNDNWKGEGPTKETIRRHLKGLVILKDA